MKQGRSGGLVVSRGASRLLAPALVVIATLMPPGAIAGEVTITSFKDNTLIESATGNLSNGAGQHLFAGRTAQFAGSIRRGVIAFDIAAAVPAGVTVREVELTLSMSMTIAGPAEVSLHRLLADWGEGTSRGGLGEGGGAPSTPGDATWMHRFFPGTLWTTPGGDFSSTVTATQEIDQIGFYSWTSAQMVADVQMWLDTPASNFGWLLRGDESAIATAKRFDTYQHLDPAVRPALRIRWGSACDPCDTNCDGSINAFDIQPFVDALSPTPPPACSPCAADTNEDGSVNGFDIQAFVECLGG